MQKWEYKRITRTRGWPSGESGREADSFNPSGYAFEQELNDFGNQGWELISVATYSDRVGEHVAGLTTCDIWIFKRPKQ